MWFIHFKFRRFSVRERDGGRGWDFVEGRRTRRGIKKTDPERSITFAWKFVSLHVSRFDSAEHGQETPNSPRETL